MRYFIMTLSVLFLSTQSMANSTLKTLSVLKDCSNDYIEVVEDMKSEIVKYSPWNYDNDYDQSQVVVSEAFDFSERSFKVKVYFDVEGLKDLGYIYSIEPTFFKDGACSFIDTSYEEM